MTPEEKVERMKNLQQQKESAETELDTMKEEVSSEILDKKLVDLTVREYLEIVGSTSSNCAMPSGEGMGDMMKNSMDMMMNNPAMMKNMMKMITGQRY